MNRQVISSRFPYLPIKITLQQHSQHVEALLDTGFDGDVIVPSTFITGNRPPDELVPWILADGSRGQAPAYIGTIEIGVFGPFQALVMVLGDEMLIGRGIIDRFAITLDHGQRVIVEP